MRPKYTNNSVFVYSATIVLYFLIIEYVNIDNNYYENVPFISS